MESADIMEKETHFIGSSRDDISGFPEEVRAVYTVRFAGTVYVLHAFQKKSKKGVKTVKHDIDLIRERLNTAAEHYARRYQGKRK